jgi:hypothetical protein
MAQIASLSLIQELKLFGDRVFAFTESASLRRAVTEAPRRLTRGAGAWEVERAFKALADAVDGLDRIAREDAERAVEASALAQEGAALCESVYDLIAP